MICIKKEVFEETLVNAYIDIKEAIENDDTNDIIHAKGFCCALENIAIHYGEYAVEDIKKIKAPIIGNISMSPNKKPDLDVPTYLRQEKVFK